MDDIHLYEANVKKVYGFFMAKTFNQLLAEDLTSEVFTTAYAQFKDPAKIIEDKQKYLYGIMKLTWLQFLRRKYEVVEDSVEEIDDFSGYVDQTIDEVAGLSLVERALPYIEQLSPTYQTVLLLRFRDCLSLKEICVHLDKNMNYVKTTQKRGLAALKQVVNSEGKI